MNRLRYFKTIVPAACLLAVLSTTLSAEDSAQPPAGEAAKLIAVLDSTDAPVFEKAMACRRLSVIGDETAVPALARLLADEKLSTYACSALEAIPGPASDAALRKAFSDLKGERLIAVLGSIGARGDAAAIGLITISLDSDDPSIVAAAARAIGHIGTPAAADALQTALPEVKPESRAAVGNACLVCILRLAEQKVSDKAVALCEAVQHADVPQHIKLAAAGNAIVALGKEGLPRLAQLLNSRDESQFRLALHVVRRLGDGAANVLAAQFKNQSPSRQALMLIALSDLGDRSALPTVLEAAKSAEGEVRVEAIHALARLGDATVLPVLFAAATQPDEQIAAAARATLATLDSGEISTEIVNMLARDDERTRQMAITMAGQRKIASAAPGLLKLARGSDAKARVAAIKALGSTAQLENITELIDLAIAAQGSNDYQAVQRSLKTACARMPQEECGKKLATAMPGTSTATRVFLLEQLASVGGATALKTVVAAAKSSEDALRDAATRLLGTWLTADAAPAMFDLAKTLPEGKYKIRALRGYVRIARQLNMPPAERLTVCRNALAIAERSEDRVLVFDVVKRYPTPEGLALAASLLNDKDLQQQACATLVAIAPGVAISAPEQVEKTLLQVLKLTTDAELKAKADKALVLARDGIQLKQEEAEFTSVFDGVSLTGWKQTGKVFRVEEGAIVGGSLEKGDRSRQRLPIASTEITATSNSDSRPALEALPIRTVASMFVRAALPPTAIRSI